MATEYGQRLNQARKEAGLTQVELAKKTGIPQSTISTAEREGHGSRETPVYAQALGVNALWLATGNGPKTGFNLANLAYISKLQGQGSDDVSKAVVVIDLDQNPDYPAIRRVKVKAQAGVSGYAIEYVDEDGPPIVFRADWYKSKGFRPERMLAMRVKGESMIPSLYEDDLIVVNTEQHTPKQGLPYLVSYEGEVVVKRLVRDDGLWWLVSDNPDQRRYPRTKCNTDTQIIGEVVYRQTERI